jgi:hypothetical protein
MIIRIAEDIRFFILVLLLVLLGFSQAFWLLSSRDPTSQFGTVPNALLTAFVFMLNSFNTDFDGTASPQIATILLVLYQLFMAILMLNLLIALMGESFSQVSANGLGFWRKELASTILEQRHLLPPNFEEDSSLKCLYVMKYTSAMKFQDVLDSHKFEAESSIMYGVDAGDVFTNTLTPYGVNAAVVSGPTSNAAAPTEPAESNARIASLEAKIDRLENSMSKLLAALNSQRNN